MFTPTTLQKMPDSRPNYMGKEWPDYYRFLSRNRDSDALTESNFRCALKAIGGETGEDDNGISMVTVVRENHWACGWIEWIAIHQTATEALKKADEIAAKLENHPVVNEDDWSELEHEQADDVWKRCYSMKERIDYIREHRSQFEFHGFSDLLQCCRGSFFGGYASEILQ